MANETTRNDLEAREKQALPEEGTRPGPVFRPDVDILEERDGYRIHADLPGVGQGQVSVHLENGVLSIDAEVAETPEAGWRALHREYGVGSYHRDFRLSDAIDASKVTATMHDGVLDLHLPKVEEQKPRRIEIRSS